jgi:hypothetical protein
VNISSDKPHRQIRQHKSDFPSCTSSDAPASGGDSVQNVAARHSSRVSHGEWNRCDVVGCAGAIEVTVNGVPQNKVTKYLPAAGQVGFQLEGVPYELRPVFSTPPYGTGSAGAAESFGT